MTRLRRFLLDLASRPFDWGSCNCGLIIADWWQANHGVDPAPHLRGVAMTKAECDALTARHGGLPVLVGRLARSVGALRSDGTQAGDFAVIRHEGRHHGAIRSPSGRWIVKAESGLTGLRDARVVAAWSV